MISPNQRTEKRENGTLRVITINDEPSMTQQQYKDECDINNIMKKYQSTGEFRHLTAKQGQYADFSDIMDYQDMLHTIQYADEAFAALPAEVRLRFKNDPGSLITFLQDDKNYDEGVKLGLLEPKPIQQNPKPNDEQNPKPNDEQVNRLKTKTSSTPA